MLIEVSLAVYHTLVILLLQVMKLIEAAERTEQRRKEEKLLHYAREGKAEEVTKLVRLPRSCYFNIGLRGITGIVKYYHSGNLRDGMRHIMRLALSVRRVTGEV